VAVVEGAVDLVDLALDLEVVSMDQRSRVLVGLLV
jgi:hypothetical protein